MPYIQLTVLSSFSDSWTIKKNIGKMSEQCIIVCSVSEKHAIVTVKLKLKLQVKYSTNCLQITLCTLRKLWFITPGWFSMMSINATLFTVEDLGVVHLRLYDERDWMTALGALTFLLCYCPDPVVWGFELSLWFTIEGKT